MDFEAQRKKRMEDLAQKRKRLEEMRKQRAEKEKGKEEESGGGREVSSEPDNTPPVTVSVSSPPPVTDVDDLVNSLLKDQTPPPSSTEPEKIEEQSPPPPAAPILSRLEQVQQRSAEWTTCQNVCSFTVLPVVNEVYEKGIQTESSGESTIEDLMEDKASSSSEPTSYHRTPQRSRQRSRGDSALEEETPSKNTSSSVKPAIKLSADDINDIMNSSSFHNFLSGSSQVVERALGLSNSIDLLRDLTAQQDDSTSSSGNSDILQRARMYNCASVDSRPVMDIQVSPHHPELFAIAYGNVSSTSSDVAGGGGVVCLWSLLLPKAPEFVFTASSPVLMVRFHPENVHIVIGACYSGQVVLWDTRSSSSSRPAQRSSSSGKGHKHPIYSMCLARRSSGSAATSTTGGGGSTDWILITASTDGLLCHWDLENLNEPASSTPLSSRVILPSIDALNSSLNFNSDLNRQQSKPLQNQENTVVSELQGQERPVSVSCMALGPDEDERKLLLGSECGTLFSFTLPFKANAPFGKTGAHFGMVTSLSVNPSSLPAFKHLLLTSSVDWTVKLWHMQSLAVSSNTSDFVQPLLTFPLSSFQYVTSTQWSPLHPGVFSTTASGGSLMLWNICQSSSEPVGVTNIQYQNSSDPAKSGTCTLNKTAWLEDGRKLLVGDSSGIVHCVAIRSAAICTLRSGDEERLELALSMQSRKLNSVRRTAEIGSSDATENIDGGSGEEKTNHSSFTALLNEH